MEEARRDAGVTSALELLLGMNDAIAAGDMQTISGNLHPDIVWEHNLGMGTPEEGVYEGRDSVIALLERMLEPWERLRAEPREMRARGSMFDVRGELRAKHSTSAAEVVSPYVQHFELRDGLLARMSMTSSDDSAWEAGDIEVVHQVVDAFRERDVPRLRGIFAEESEFESAITSVETRIYRGLDEIEGYMRDVQEAFDEWHSEDERYLDAGDGRVVLDYRIVGRGKGSGVPIDQPIAILWTVRDGKILRGQGFLDPGDAIKAAGLE